RHVDVETVAGEDTPGLAGQGLRQLVASIQEVLGDRPKRSRSPILGGVTPYRECSGRGADGSIDLGQGSIRPADMDLAGRGVEDVTRGALAGDEGAVDQ